MWRHVSVQSNHHEAKYKTQYWYIQRVLTLWDPIFFYNCINITDHLGNVFNNKKRQYNCCQCVLLKYLKV
jgi:hypothetical protein